MRPGGTRGSRVLVGLGSSLEDRAARMSLALARLAADPGLRLLRHSRLYRSRPMGPARGGFLNAVALIETRHSPRGLLALCKDIERQLGRRAGPRWVDRPIDLDLLWWEGIQRQGTSLRLPHPGLLTRDFVLLPACEVGADLPLPGGGRLGQAGPPSIRTGAYPVSAGDPLGQPWPAAAPSRAGQVDPVSKRPELFLELHAGEEAREGAAQGLADGIVLHVESRSPTLGREMLGRLASASRGPILIVLSEEAVIEGLEPWVWLTRLPASLTRRIVVGPPPGRQNRQEVTRMRENGLRLAWARSGASGTMEAGLGAEGRLRCWDLEAVPPRGEAMPAPWLISGIRTVAELEVGLMRSWPRLALSLAAWGSVFAVPPEG